ncbi:uncharacterized protein [Cherax quadricarinatus]|uniref:uncharacterized protein n=1 Tax=Cherax quadricarinatus TaxID=27406 RepID=UPI0023782351|nr:uncharacterized protein LOC128687231 [Cherax quadricarinatus]
MKVLMSALLMVALVVMVADASPQASEGTSACPDVGPEIAMDALTDELCVHADKTRCDANMDSCRHHHNPSMHDHVGDWKDRMIENITICATELGYTYNPASSSEEKSGESDESCVHHCTFENHLVDLGITKDELVPMIRCLMILKESLETYRECINQ